MSKLRQIGVKEDVLPRSDTGVLKHSDVISQLVLAGFFACHPNCVPQQTEDEADNAGEGRNIIMWRFPLGKFVTVALRHALSPDLPLGTSNITWFL